MSLACTLTVGSEDLSAFVVGITRTQTLETPAGDTLELEMAPDGANNAWYYLTGIGPYSELSLDEQGTRVFTGYVNSILATRDPRKIVITAKPKTKLAEDYFIAQDMDSSGETVSYWVDKLCNECSMPYSLLSVGSITTGSTELVGPEAKYGMRSAMDGLMELIAYCNWHMRNAADGTVEFLEVTTGSAAERTLTPEAPGGWEVELSDEYARNTIKVWGCPVTDEETSTSGSGGFLYYKTTTNLPGYDYERCGVISDAQIDTVLKAKIVGEILLGQYGSLQRIVSATCLGDPDVRVGQTISISGLPYVEVVTDAVTEMNSSGYRTKIIMGRRSGRLPYMPTSGSKPHFHASIILGDVDYECFDVSPDIPNGMMYSMGTWEIAGSGNRKCIGAMKQKIVSPQTRTWVGHNTISITMLQAGASDISTDDNIMMMAGSYESDEIYYTAYAARNLDTGTYTYFTYGALGNQVGRMRAFFLGGYFYYHRSVSTDYGMVKCDTGFNQVWKNASFVYPVCHDGTYIYAYDSSSYPRVIGKVRQTGSYVSATTLPTGVGRGLYGTAGIKDTYGCYHDGNLYLCGSALIKMSTSWVVDWNVAIDLQDVTYYGGYLWGVYNETIYKISMTDGSVLASYEYIDASRVDHANRIVSAGNNRFVVVGQGNSSGATKVYMVATVQIVGD